MVKALLVFFALIGVAQAQFLGPLVSRPFEAVFDNSGLPLPFFNQTPAVNYDSGGQGIAYNVPAPGCVGSGCSAAALSYRPDAVNFKSSTFSGIAFQLGFNGAPTSVPAGLPSHFALGVQGGNVGTGDVGWMTASGVPWDYRWSYFPATTTDNTPGTYVSDSVNNGYLASGTRYDSLSSSFSLASLANTTTMAAYYADLVAQMKSMLGWNLWYSQRNGSSQATITTDGSTATYTGTSGTDDSITAGNFHSTGKWVVRFNIVADGNAAHMEIGLADHNSRYSDGYIGQTTDSMAINGSGMVINNVFYVSTAATATLTTGNTVDLAVDFDAKRVWVRTNSGNWNGNASYVPGDSNGANISTLAASSFAPAADLYTNGDKITFGTPPTLTGFSAWNSSPATPAMVLHIEPDLWGFFQQQGGPGGTQTDDPTQVVVSVASSGYSGLGSLPNTAVGFAQAHKLLRDTYAPNILLAYHASRFGPNLVYNPYNSSTATAISAGQRVGNFYNALNTKFDLIYHDTADRDAGRGVDPTDWWNSTAFENFRQYLLAFSQTTIVPNMLWQTPEGNTLYQSENNTNYHYQDDRAEFFLASPNGVPNSPVYNSSNISNFAGARVIGILFGTGGINTDNFDHAGDGITNPGALGTQGNPLPAHANSATATVSDDDGGFLRGAAAAYYAAPASLHNDPLSYSYTINVASPGPYTITLWAGSPSAGGSWNAYIDSQLVGNIVTLNTGSYSALSPAVSPTFNTTLGTHILKLAWASGDSTGSAGDLVAWQGGPASTSGPSITTNTTTPSAGDTVTITYNPGTWTTSPSDFIQLNAAGTQHSCNVAPGSNGSNAFPISVATPSATPGPHAVTLRIPKVPSDVPALWQAEYWGNAQQTATACQGGSPAAILVASPRMTVPPSLPAPTYPAAPSYITYPPPGWPASPNETITVCASGCQFTNLDDASWYINWTDTNRDWIKIDIPSGTYFATERYAAWGGQNCSGMPGGVCAQHVWIYGHGPTRPYITCSDTLTITCGGMVSSDALHMVMDNLEIAHSIRAGANSPAMGGITCVSTVDPPSLLMRNLYVHDGGQGILNDGSCPYNVTFQNTHFARFGGPVGPAHDAYFNDFSKGGFGVYPDVIWDGHLVLDHSVFELVDTGHTLKSHANRVDIDCSQIVGRASETYSGSQTIDLDGGGGQVTITNSLIAAGQYYYNNAANSPWFMEFGGDKSAWSGDQASQFVVMNNSYIINDSGQFMLGLAAPMQPSQPYLSSNNVFIGRWDDGFTAGDCDGSIPCKTPASTFSNTGGRIADMAWGCTNNNCLSLRDTGTASSSGNLFFTTRAAARAHNWPAALPIHDLPPRTDQGGTVLTAWPFDPQFYPMPAACTDPVGNVQWPM
jgi:hypothetical protein